MAFKCKIIDISPESKYNDTVYSQAVTVTLLNGDDLTVFDPNMAVTESDLGGCAVIDIGLIFGNDPIEDVASEQKGIERHGDSDISWKGHTYIGEIQEVLRDGNRLSATLDVGFGELSFRIDETEVKDIDTGDWVKLEVISSQLKEITICG